ELSWVDVLALMDTQKRCQQHHHTDIRHCPGCISQLEEAVALYSGEFMPDFVIADSDQFEAWQTAQRLTYQQQVTDTLFLLASHFEGHDLALAHRYAQKLVSLDQLDERGQQLSLRILAQQGQR